MRRFADLRRATHLRWRPDVRWNGLMLRLSAYVCWPVHLCRVDHLSVRQHLPGYNIVLGFADLYPDEDLRADLDLSG